VTAAEHVELDRDVEFGHDVRRYDEPTGSCAACGDSYMLGDEAYCCRECWESWHEDCFEQLATPCAKARPCECQGCRMGRADRDPMGVLERVEYANRVTVWSLGITQAQRETLAALAADGLIEWRTGAVPYVTDAGRAALAKAAS
jgi:hypothetical protein